VTTSLWAQSFSHVGYNPIERSNYHTLLSVVLRSRETKRSCSWDPNILSSWLCRQTKPQPSTWAIGCHHDKGTVWAHIIEVVLVRAINMKVKQEFDNGDFIVWDTRDNREEAWIWSGPRSLARHQSLGLYSCVVVRVIPQVVTIGAPGPVGVNKPLFMSWLGRGFRTLEWRIGLMSLGFHQVRGGGD
jgi:hypothetical protein